MYPFINTYNASDTDSIYTYYPEEYVGNKLGHKKLEHTFDEAIFLFKKVYGGINSLYELVKVWALKSKIC